MTSTTCTNTLTAHTLSATNPYGGSPTSAQGGVGANVDMESILAQLGMFSGGDASETSGDLPPRSTRGRFPVMNQLGYGTVPVGQFNEQGLKNVKLTTKNGKELNLQEDMQGNLYDGKEEVGAVNQETGAVTMNSSEAGKRDAKVLHDGDKNGFWDFGHAFRDEADSAGNRTFDSGEVTVNAGDLTPNAPSSQQSASARPANFDTGDFPGIGQFPGNGPFPGMNQLGYGADPVGQFNEQGLKNVKLTTKNGKELNLQEDMQGNLYDGKEEVGAVDQNDGSVTMNSSEAGKRDAKILHDGDKNGFWDFGHAFRDEADSAGNRKFDSGEVTVNAGNLPDGAQQPQQAGPVNIPASRGPSFYPLQSVDEIPVGVPLFDSPSNKNNKNKPDIEEA